MGIWLFQDNLRNNLEFSIRHSIRLSPPDPIRVSSSLLPRTRSEIFFSELRPTLHLAIPLIIAELGWMAMGIVDTMMVGRLPNSAVAIGAVSLGGGLYYTVAIFGSGLLLGLDTLVSQAFGRKDLADARTSLVNSLILALVLAPLMMGVVSLWPPLMQRMNIDPQILREMGPFLRALNWSTLPLALYFALRRYLQAVGIVKPITFRPHLRQHHQRPFQLDLHLRTPWFARLRSARLGMVHLRRTRVHHGRSDRYTALLQPAQRAWTV